MTDSMIERMARAIFDAENGIDGDCVGDMLYEDFRIDGPRDEAIKTTMLVCRCAARAVLEALRDPTPEMILAASSRSDNGDRETMYHSIWRAMVDKAMEE